MPRHQEAPPPGRARSPLRAARGGQPRARPAGSVSYAYLEEGLLTTPATAAVPAGIDRGRVTFEQGDAQAMRPDLGTSDVLLMANLVDRLADPRRCLGSLPSSCWTAPWTCPS